MSTMICSRHHCLVVASLLLVACSNAQPPAAELIQDDSRDSYCTEPGNYCVRVYCKSPTRRWSCQTSYEVAVEIGFVCDYFLKTFQEVSTGNVDNDDAKSVVLPYCGSNSPPSGYEYIGTYFDEVCPSAYPREAGDDKDYPRYWTECA